MKPIRHWQFTRWLPLLVILLAVAVLAGTVLFGRQQLRSSVQAQMIQREGEILRAAVRLLQETGGGLPAPYQGPLSDPGEQLNLILSVSRLKGVMGVRLFNPAGQFLDALPASVTEGSLSVEDLDRLLSLKAVCRFQSAAHLNDYLMALPTSTNQTVADLPLLLVTLPLHEEGQSQLAGIAQFLIEGYGLQYEFQLLDHSLNRQSLVAFGVGALLIVVALAWAFHRLDQRTRHLIRANQELALAARTSAVGAVAAHLIHGLKNPLAGLQSFMNSRSPENGLDEADWQLISASANRMQILINEVIGVMREEQEAPSYELTTAELSELVLGRVQALATQKGVRLVLERVDAATVSNRTANLLTLVLVNLLQNALQATASGKKVTLSLAREGGNLRCQVRDEGTGLPDAIRHQLFTPCRSGKEGGCGIGLAISKQLANHLQAQLEMISTGAHGTLFQLQVPVREP
jgi:signal transduction histidine kinase